MMLLHGVLVALPCVDPAKQNPSNLARSPNFYPRRALVSPLFCPRFCLLFLASLLLARRGCWTHSATCSSSSWLATYIHVVLLYVYSSIEWLSWHDACRSLDSSAIARMPCFRFSFHVLQYSHSLLTHYTCCCFLFYSKNECYEWFESYDGIKHLLTSEMLSPADGVSTSRPRRTIQVRDRDGNLVPRSIVCMDESPRLMTPTKFPPRETSRVLILGCGNSALGQDMLQNGWTGGITNVDFSKVVIEQMKERYDEDFYKQMETSYKNAAGSNSSNNSVKPMEFVCADVTSSLPFEDGSFDVIVCKGTLDAILSSAGSIASAKRMMHECCRLLADEHGALVIVSHASPDNRLVFLENSGDEWWAGLNVHHLRKDRDASTSETPGAR